MSDKIDNILSLEIQLQGKELAGKVLITNGSDQEVNLWALGSSWGDYCLSFELHYSNGSVVYTRKPQRYTRNAATLEVLIPNGVFAIDFDLNSNAWISSGKSLKGAPKALTANYKTDASEKTAKYNVWTGNITGSTRI